MTGNDSNTTAQLPAPKLGRRYALSLLGASGLATTFLIGAQNKAEAKADYTPKVIQDWIIGQQSNPILLANLYTNNGIFEDVPNGFKIQGSSNILCFAQGIQKIFGNIKIELQDVFATERFAVAEYYFSATNNGFIPVPNTLGKSFRVQTTTLFELKGHKIKRSSDYYDNAAILVQLGLIPPPPPASPPGC
ncbi:ester cyclase [Nostoc sphaeroides]|uniref:Nuclear transport factor 2 family protein n=1 Tax=Nostoc sphaeroides CCNUC1 TaxID=2653204 RepID=A0A5P8WB14_9NOSO|nr:ester cyclase [Nostoc sphaeroides]QFS49099.1 nuclear transport factor 2 family protein [Nostoc sphaeroides CCNUC1]